MLGKRRLIWSLLGVFLCWSCCSCKFDISPCTFDPTRCGSTGKCEDRDDDPKGYICNCHSGYEHDKSVHHCVEANTCKSASARCGVGGTCKHVGVGEYECICKSGYRRGNTNKHCIEINVCYESPDICGVGGLCRHMGPADYECECNKKGFRAESKTKCVDIDECDEETHFCAPLGTCVNTIGGYRCKCKKGYKPRDASQQSCIDKNECDADPNPCQLKMKVKAGRSASPYSGVCRNIEGGYECDCSKGYENDPNDRTKCIDVDECARGAHNCDTTVSSCKNEIGYYICECNSGYKHKQDSVYECVDIDECVEGVNGDEETQACDPVAAACVNYTGSYGCECYTGYESDQDAIKRTMADGCKKCCKDIDECKTKTDKCGDVCVLGTQAEGLPIGTNYTCGCLKDPPKYPITQFACAVCQYTEWGEWGPCDVSCGTGSRHKTRQALPTLGKSFPECEHKELIDSEAPCLERPCDPEGCHLSPWSIWTECDKPCGGGSQTRSRTIISSTGSSCKDKALEVSQKNKRVGCKLEANSDRRRCRIGGTWTHCCRCHQIAQQKTSKSRLG